jgi:hypothetical protein
MLANGSLPSERRGVPSTNRRISRQPRAANEATTGRTFSKKVVNIGAASLWWYRHAYSFK